MNGASPETTVDVLIVSSRDLFWQQAQRLLKGYYPYRLHFIKDSEVLMSASDHKPVLALIDGHGGTTAVCEWVQGVKMTHSSCPLIVLYGPEDSLDFSKVKKNGADFIMHMSFDCEFVSDMILRLAPVELKGNQIPVSALMPIDMYDIDTNEEIQFDVYIYLPSNEKTFRVRKKGGKIDNRLSEKSQDTHRRLYIKKTQARDFFNYARNVLMLKTEADPSPMTEKVYRSKELIQGIISEFFNAEAGDFQAGKSIMENCRQILTQLSLDRERTQEERIKEITRFTGYNRSTYQDAINMAIFSGHFAALLGLPKEKVETAALAGLLHNVGLAQMPASTIGKSSPELTPEEFLDYKIYPDRSVILIKAKKVPLTPEISTAIVQHQENANGKGFPHQIDGQKIDPLGKILRLALRFLELTSMDGTEVMVTPKTAITLIRDESMTENAIADLTMASSIYKKIP